MIGPFCGGEAHSEIANMAEKVWSSCSSTILKLLQENPGYDLVLTGHSLGAGAAALLHVYLQYHSPDWMTETSSSSSSSSVPPKVYCCVFACPPVFAPIHVLSPQAMESCTNYIHGVDAVPFLSVDSVRQTLHSLAQIQQTTTIRLPWWKRLQRFVWRGRQANLQRYARTVQQARNQRLPTKPGAPMLCIPAAHNYWIREQQQQEEEVQGNDSRQGDSSTETTMSNTTLSSTSTTTKTAWKTFDVKACDSEKLAQFGVQMNLKMLYDHFPQRYEYALHSLVHDDDYEEEEENQVTRTPTSSTTTSDPTDTI